MSLPQLHTATTRLIRHVDALDEAAYDGPSLLPGWSRAFVVAHLALNAEALAGALRGVITGDPVPMYASNRARDLDIETLGTAAAPALRARLYGATTDLAEAAAMLPDDRLEVAVERTPGSDRTFAAGDVVAMRLREVEIHLVDLDCGYRTSDWDPEVAAAFVTQLAGRAAATLVAADQDLTWHAEGDGPTVTGTAADLAWWLSGRGSGDGLRTDGVLPGIEAW